MIDKLSINIKTLIVLGAIIVLAGFVRIYKITENPVSLNIDEVSTGYNAYSILKTARDEYGVFLPVSFESVGDYKPGGLIYLTVPSIAIFGLNEFGVRFPTALISTLSLIAFYFLFELLTKSRKVALLAVGLLAISPWHIYYSRYASESMVATSFFGLGFLAFLKLPQGRWYWKVISSVFLTLALYTYHTHRLFIPLFLSFILITNPKETIKFKKDYYLWAAILLVLSLPLLYSIIFAQGETRAGMTIILNDIEFNRQIRLYDYPFLNNGHNFLINFFNNDYFLLLFYWLRKYLNYFHPAFFFYDGLEMLRTGAFGLGVTYLFELPCLLYGIFILVKSKTRLSWIIFAWILIGFIPSSLTVNEQHPLRTLIAAPAIELLSALGGLNLFWAIRRLTSQKLRYLIYLGFGFLVVFCFIQAYLIFSFYFPREKGEDFMEGTKEAAVYASEHKNDYQQVIFDPVRGVEAPSIVNIPHMYILFYSGFDPLTYQHLPKVQVLGQGDNNQFGFDKFVIRRIDWNKERVKKRLLLIGSPWSLPLAQIPSDKILKRIYLTNGALAYLVVSTD